VAKNVCPQANIIVNRENLGFAAACNLGAKRAAGSLLLFVNPDLFVDSDSIEKLASFVAGKERIGAVGGRVRNPDGSFQPTCRNLPTFSNILLSRGSIIGKVLKSSHAYTLPDSAGPVEVPAVAGTFLMIRKEAFEIVNRFDTRFFMFMEDTDLCKRLNILGFANYFVPAGGAVHEWGTGSNVSSTRRSWLHHISAFKYFARHRPGLFTYLILPIMLVLNFLMVACVNLFKISRVH
jgi:GT2 family glycosyltransferase